MSSLMDDYSAELRMLEQNHRKLSEVDPGNELLKHAKIGVDSIRWGGEFWKTFSNDGEQSIYAYARYNQAMRDEIRKSR